MKKIIIPENITQALDSHDTIFGRAAIPCLVPVVRGEPECPGARKADLIIAGFKLLLMEMLHADQKLKKGTGFHAR